MCHGNVNHVTGCQEAPGFQSVLPHCWAGGRGDQQGKAKEKLNLSFHLEDSFLQSSIQYPPGTGAPECKGHSAAWLVDTEENVLLLLLWWHCTGSVTCWADYSPCGWCSPWMQKCFILWTWAGAAFSYGLGAWAGKASPHCWHQGSQWWISQSGLVGVGSDTHTVIMVESFLPYSSPEWAQLTTHNRISVFSNVRSNISKGFWSSV